MNNDDILLGELREFKRATIAELHDIKKHVEMLRSFYWKFLGASTVSAFIATLLIEAFRK